MKIVNLKSENIKRIVAVEIEPDGNFVEITGRNAQGKSSVLDSIYMALAGAKAIPDKPIRDGQDAAHVRLDLGDVIVRREFREREGGKVATRVTVETADGARYSSPQKMLDDLLGTLSFDPMAFCRMDDRRRYDVVADMAGIDLKDMDEKNRSDYAERRRVNRLANQSLAACESIVVPERPTGDGDGVEALLDELNDANRANVAQHDQIRETDHRNRQVDGLLAELRNAEQKRDDLRCQIDEVEKRIAYLSETAAAFKAEIEAMPELPPLVDTDEIRRRIDGARAREDLIRQIEDAERRQEDHMVQHKQYLAESESLTEAMNRRSEKMRQLIEDADLPEGMELEGGKVLVGGIPFAQLSSSEQIRQSCAIACRQNAGLGVVLMRDGSLLDSASLAIVHDELAVKRDKQIWLERVDESGKVGFVIEDGRLMERDGE